MQSFFLHFHNILLMLVENRLKAEIQGLGAAIAQEGADPGPSLAVLKVIEEEKLMHNVHRLVGKIMHSKFTISSYNWYVWYLMNVRLWWSTFYPLHYTDIAALLPLFYFSGLEQFWVGSCRKLAIGGNILATLLAEDSWLVSFSTF